MAKIFKMFAFSTILALTFGIWSLPGLSSEFGQTKWIAEADAEEVGTLHVVITPQEAIDDGAQWRVDGGAWRNGGAYVALEVSSYTVDFKIISGWAAPSTRTASIVDGQITEINGVYSQNTGALAVTLTPQGAVDAGAQWNVDGGAWQDSGFIVDGVSDGNHTVSYKTVVGWEPPPSEIVAIVDAQTMEIARAYAEQTGSLSVIISPQGAVDGGSQWKVDGGPWQASGATVSGLRLGDHEVIYKPTFGWNPPNNDTVTVTGNQLTETKGNYTVRLGITIHVPADYTTIQAAIDASSNGDTVLVAEGNYYGLGNKNLDFKGKAIRIASESGPNKCIIDCEGEGRGFFFNNTEKEDSVIYGFTITNGSVMNPEGGGGIYCHSASPSILNCTISGNMVHEYNGFGVGGGIYCDSASPSILNCTISGNMVHGYNGFGGGIFCRFSSPTVSNCIVIGNMSGNSGGGICCFSFSSPTITNCTISGNTASCEGSGAGGGLCIGDNSSATITNCTISYNINESWDGGGISYFGGATGTMTGCTIFSNTAGREGGISCHSSSPIITNCILWNNLPQQGSGCDTITYSDIQGGYTGEGNIDANPLFVDPENGNFHLSASSPCINVGNNDAPNLPETDKDGNPRIMDCVVDMGAYEYPGAVLAKAAFIGEPLSGPNPLSVNFTDQSSGTITSWQWAFGDDNATSTEQNPSHIYKDSGMYTVALTVTGPCGSDTKTKGDYISVGQGSLTVMLSPQQAIDCGAKWNVDGGEWQVSGTTVSGLSIGNHTVCYKSVIGWNAPPSEAVTVTTDQTVETTGLYTIITYKITAIAGPGGSIIPSGSLTVAYGTDQSFTITPDTGYQVSDVLVDGSSVGAVTSYTFTNVTENHTIEASFTILTYTITATAGANGSIIPSGDVTVSYGADQTFTLTPVTSYHVSDVLVDGSSVGAATTYTFTNVIEGHTIHAEFALNTYVVVGRVTENGAGLENVFMDGLPRRLWSDPNGFYSVMVDYGWSGTVTPEKRGYAFEPVFRNFSNVTSNQLNQNFAATQIAAINLGHGNGRRGGQATIPVIFTPVDNPDISAISVDIGYDTSALEGPTAIIGAAASAADKEIATSEISPGVYRISIFSPANNNPIGVGIISYLTFHISLSAPFDITPLSNTPNASDPSGHSVLIGGTDGTINVTQYAAGDCDESGSVSIAEVQYATNMFLEITPVEPCVDVTGDEEVGIGEVQKVINNHLMITAQASESFGAAGEHAIMANGIPSLDLTRISGKPGETVSVPVTLTNVSGYEIAAVSTDVSYDVAVFENARAEIGPAGSAAGKYVVFNEISSGILRVGVSGVNQNLIGDGVVAYVVFDIKTDAVMGQTDLGNAPSASDQSGNDVPIEGESGAVTAMTILYVSHDGVCNDNEPCYTLIQDAIDAADSVTLIRVTEGTYDEALIIDQPKNLTIQGGWDSTFTTRTSNTAVRSMRISAGTVKSEYLVTR